MLANLFIVRLSLVIATTICAVLASLIPNDKIAKVFKIISFITALAFAVVEVVHPNDVFFVAKIGCLFISRQILLIWPAGFATLVFDSDVERWLDKVWIIETMISSMLIMIGILGALLSMPIPKILEVIK